MLGSSREQSSKMVSDTTKILSGSVATAADFQLGDGRCGSAQCEITSTDMSVNLPLGEVHRVVHCQSAPSQASTKSLI